MEVIVDSQQIVGATGIGCHTVRLVIDSLRKALTTAQDSDGIDKVNISHLGCLEFIGGNWVWYTFDTDNTEDGNDFDIEV